MVKQELKSLPSDTVRLIGSSQVIASVFSVVKELTENAFDADCTTLEVKLENYGLDKVEVRDNGFGIKKEAVPLVARRHHTSKISSFSDLEHLETYGFRGEALGSLCAVSTLSITSKTAEEDISHTYTFDHHGNMVSQIPSHLGQGTTITAVNIFKNMPVRRQFYNTVKKKKEELKKIEDLLMAYGAIRPDVRVVLKNNKDTVWQKPVHPDTRTVLLAIFGRSAVAQMVHKVAECSESKVKVEAYLPKGDSEVSITSRSTNDRCFLAVNKRPVQMKDMEKIVKQHYCVHMKCDGRHPMFYISITVPSGEVDVNVDPNKTKVMLHQQVSVIQLLTKVLEELYVPIKKVEEEKEVRISEELNDSTLSDASSDSSVVLTISNGTDNSAGRECLKEKNYNTGRIYTGVKNKLPAEKTERVSNIGRSLNEEDRNDFVVNFSDGRTERLDDHNEVNVTENNNLVLGNKLIVHHSGSSLHNKSDESSVNSEGAGNNSFKDTENKDLGDFQTKTKNAECVDGTQIDRGNFEILDDELEELLKTQKSSGKTVDVTSAILNDTDDLLAELDVTLVGDIGEVGKKFDKTVDLREGKVVETLSEDNLKENKSEGYGVDKALDWSKGTAGKERNGDLQQPVQVLAGGSHMTRKRPASPDHCSEISAVTPPVKRKSTESSLDQPKLYDMVGKTTTEKYPLGFLAFSKEVRPKVLEDNSSASYDEVTAMLKRQWQELPDLEKKIFEDEGKTQVQDLKKKVSEKKRLAQKLDNRLKVSGTPSIKEQLLASSGRKTSSQSVAVKSMRVSFSLKKLQQIYSSGLRQSLTQPDNRLKLIGPLKFYNSWLCCHGNKLQVINPHRVEETLIYRELMENHIIPASKLENTIGVTESSVGGADLYRKLLAMVPSNIAQTYVYIDDKRLKANGIEIRCHMDQDSRPVLEVVGLASCMPMYGIRDLQEILELIVNSGARSIYQARPLKVSFYLQGEAVRMVRQRPVHRSREDILELLEQMEDSLPADCATCLHNKQFKQTVYNLNDIPLTQNLS